MGVPGGRERDRDDSECWVYRLLPMIDSKTNEHCIAKRKGLFTRDDILKDLGSGLYEIFVNNARGKDESLVNRVARRLVKSFVILACTSARVVHRRESWRVNRSR
jgi:hypothetical protein